MVDFAAAFVIPFDRQHHPLTPHIERLQDVIEDLVQRQRRWRSGSDTTKGVERQVPQTALRSISSESLASMGYLSFAESRNMDSNRSAFADHKSTTTTAHRQIRCPRKTSNQLKTRMHETCNGYVPGSARNRRLRIVAGAIPNSLATSF
jgi:hypothetical protein